MGSAVYFVAYLTQGPAVAMWAVAITALASAFLTRTQYFKAIFNASQYVVSLTLAGFAYSWLGGSSSDSFLANPVPVAAFIIVDFFVNTGLLSVVFWQVTGERIPKVWRGLVTDAYLGHFAVMTLGLVAAEVLRFGIMAVVALGLILLFLQRLFASYFTVVRRSRRREQILAAILNATDNGILMVGADGHIVHANDRAAEFLGLEQEKLLSMRASDLPPPFNDPLVPVADEVVMGGEPERVLRFVRTPVSGGPESETGYVLSLTDLTQEREAARKLDAWDATIRTLVAAVDARDEYTHGHSERVSEYAVALGRLYKLSFREIEDLRYAGLLHDIGKIGVDDAILRKRGALTHEERILMMEHPAKGAAILSQAPAFKSLIPAVLHHHEWYAGGGYPTGRKAKDMPIGARIIGVVDAFDAMTSNRQYRAAMPVEEALRRLEQGKGTQFDPELVDIFVEAVKTGKIELLHDATSEQPAPPIDGEEEAGRSLGSHLRELEAVYRIASETRHFLDLDRLLPQVMEILSEILGPNHYYVVFLEPSGEVRVVAEVGGSGPQELKTGDLGEWAIRTGQAVHYRRSQREMAHIRPRGENTGSAIGVPLKVEGEVLGALCFEAQDADAYRRENLYLLMAVAGQVASAVQIARFHEKVRQAAFHDGLTGVYNHTYFHEEAEKLLAESMREGYPLSLVLVDANGLKQVNDRYGHLAGDRLLCHYVEVLKGHIRKGEVLARCGGDEFVLILPGVDRSEAVERMRRCTEEVGTHLRWNHVEIPLRGMAWGVASYPADANRVSDLLQAADTAMYEQKRRMAREPVPLKRQIKLG